MERAKELLAEKTVTETAFEVGYNNSSYFGSVFKKQFGMTPLQFKKKGEPPADVR
jgi:AraC-like DNA-binding protein